ncbi:hypothetical protein EIP91_010459 [Steccherinum ochraceum]|uniref:Enoyl reductase (ER) domain-containing protein n=1 Tax=Steccherinum ochraceum TaxID=92696 RepID=A0A4R0RZ95_9APHY|nr:hypothetical protein EIP91_010459 [Steccherinum ochraceum]
MSTIPQTHEAVGLTAKGEPLSSFQVSTPKPGPEEVLVKVEWTAGTSVTVWILDFKVIDPGYPFVVGENVVGEVVAVGEGVDEVKVGDRVVSFSFSDGVAGKASQEYAILSKWSIGKLPSNITPQEGATIPDNLVTAYYSLFDRLGLPVPTSLPSSTPPQDADTPIVIWAASGSVGQYATQLLHLAGYKKIFAVASARHHASLRSLGATHTFDYTSANVTDEIRAAAGGPVKLVFDAIGDEAGSLKPISQIVGEGAKVVFLLPIRVGKPGAVEDLKISTDLPFPKDVEMVPVGGRFYQHNEQFKRDLQPKIIPDLLARGLVKPNKVREVEGASLLEKVVTSVDLLRKNAVSGERLVYRVAKD